MGATRSLLAALGMLLVVGASRPAQAGDAADGRRLTIRLTDGRQVGLRGFRIDRVDSFSAAACGVIIATQRLMTMGIDETEVYTCVELVAAGVLPPERRAQRIGLIYDVSSPNSAFRTAVVLREANGRWQVDPAYAGRFDDAPAGRSIPALRRALR